MPAEFIFQMPNGDQKIYKLYYEIAEFDWMDFNKFAEKNKMPKEKNIEVLTHPNLCEYTFYYDRKDRKFARLTVTSFGNLTSSQVIENSSAEVIALSKALAEFINRDRK